MKDMKYKNQSKTKIDVGNLVKAKVGEMETCSETFVTTTYTYIYIIDPYTNMFT